VIKQALLCQKLENNAVQCLLCAHKCKIASGQKGICGVRKNLKGELRTLVYGQAIAASLDPIEKKPLYHFFPGSSAYSIATLGCNFKCGFCQNWQISQVPQGEQLPKGKDLMPEEVVARAKAQGAKSISYTYTEPTIFFEYAFDTAKLAKENGLYNNFVTNGYMGKPALEMIHPYLDAANVDLKSFRDDFYKKTCKARLEPVLESIKLMKELNIWVEITTLLIPGQNDSKEELGDIAGFIASLGQGIPWHISRFRPDYRFTDHKPTPIEKLKEAKDIGEKAGLKYVYLGNVQAEPDTRCYNCQKTLIKRVYFTIEENNVKKGKCVFCGTVVDGVFP
jgi:pyruvate formate lyase activating enzyme